MQTPVIVIIGFVVLVFMLNRHHQQWLKDNKAAAIDKSAASNLGLGGARIENFFAATSTETRNVASDRYDPSQNALNTLDNVPVVVPIGEYNSDPLTTAYTPLSANASARFNPYGPRPWFDDVKYDEVSGTVAYSEKDVV